MPEDNPDWRPEWSRHYDSVQWTSIYVFTTGVLILLAYAYSGTAGKSPMLCFLGLWFTNVTVYFTAGFREFRNVLRDGVKNPEEYDFLIDRSQARAVRMWPVFLITFGFVDCGWLNLYWQQGHFLVTGLGGIASLLVLCWAWELEARRLRGRQIASRAWQTYIFPRPKTEVESGQSPK